MIGEFQNVKLSDSEWAKLVERFGLSVTQDYVERLSCWLKNTRKRRPSHYACLLTWIRKDRTLEVHHEAATPKEPLLEEAELLARAECLQRVTIREGDPKTVEQCREALRRMDQEKGLLA